MGDRCAAPSKLEVHVISMRPKVTGPIARVFPEARLFPAIDMRKADPLEMLQDGVITESAYESLTRGRKYHHEFSGAGGVGVYLGIRKILEASNGPVLIMEDDCVPSSELPRVVQRMLGSEADSFDMAVFGPLFVESSAVAPDHPGFGWLTGYFWGMHAVLYTAHGRRAVREALSGACDMQVDGKLSRASVYTDLRVDICLPTIRTLVQTTGASLASQSFHFSSIQTKSCPACDISPTVTDRAGQSGYRNRLLMQIVAAVIAAVIVSAAAVSAVKFHRRWRVREY